MAALTRGLLAVGVVLTLVGFTVTLAGVGSLQWKANDLNIDVTLKAAKGNPTPETVALDAAYTSTFVNSLYTPYPLNPSYQFGFAWWLLMGEFVVFLLTVALLLMPKYVHNAKLVVLAFLASFQYMAWSHINTVLYLSRNEVAKSVFGTSRIVTTLVGLFFVAVGNGVTITSLGLWPQDDHTPVAVSQRNVKSADTVEHVASKV